MLHRLDGDGFARALAGNTHAAPASVAELTQVEGRLAELAEVYADGAIGRNEWLAARDRLEARREKLVATMASQTGTTALTLLLGPGGPREQWKTKLTFDQRHTVMRAAVARLEVGPAVKGRNFFDPDRLRPPKGDIEFRL
jgi:site-specific DNA recombinase